MAQHDSLQQHVPSAAAAAVRSSSGTSPRQQQHHHHNAAAGPQQRQRQPHVVQEADAGEGAADEQRGAGDEGPGALVTLQQPLIDHVDEIQQDDQLRKKKRNYTPLAVG